MTDIVERLRAAANNPRPGFRGLHAEAADEIERLRKWQADACDLLVQGARYEYGDTAEHLRLLREAAHEPIPEWLADPQ